MKGLLLSGLGLLFLGVINLVISTSLSLSQATQKPQSADSSKDLEEAGRLNSSVIKLFAEGKFDEALPLAKRVLEIREVNLEAADDRIGVAVLNLAEIYNAKKRLSEARSLFERALGFYEKKLGLEDLRVAAVLDRLGIVYFARSNYSKSEDALKRALAIRERMIGVSEEARRTRAQGKVIGALTIDETGRVIEAHDMCGANPLLAIVSIEAAYKAEFSRPTSQGDGYYYL